MRHLTAVHLEIDGGGWRYASLSRRGGYPLGYCADHAPHASEADARECYAKYQRDHVRLNGHCSWSSCDVKDCPNPANRHASIEGDGYAMATLCTDHFTVEHAITALHIDGPSGDAWCS